MRSSLKGLRGHIAAFEKAAADATDPEKMAAKISETSDRKKYNFSAGLQHDVRATRAAIREVKSTKGDFCTFGDLFKQADGKIANLNRVLQNLKKANEVSFDVEIFFEGAHTDEKIHILAQFWDEEYHVDEENCFRPGRSIKNVPEEERRGRSYVKDNLETLGVTNCAICQRQVEIQDRLTVRGKVYHLNCIECVWCKSRPREKADFVTFDGRLCCSTECIKLYDAAHVRQKRN